MDRERLSATASRIALPEPAARALDALVTGADEVREEVLRCGDDFLRRLASLLWISPPVSESLRRYPDWLQWIKSESARCSEQGATHDIVLAWERFCRQTLGWEQQPVDLLRAFKRREYGLIAFLDVNGLWDLTTVVQHISGLADFVVRATLELVGGPLVEESADPARSQGWLAGFTVIAMGKLGAFELNYSSDIDLIFCRPTSDDPAELRFHNSLAERVTRALSVPGVDGFLYRVDLRLRPYGETGPLVPTLDSLQTYYESWGETWERQALIKARFIGGNEELGRRFSEFAAKHVFGRPMEDAELEEIKRVRHRAEREYSLPAGQFNVKQGPGGIRDVEFYVQFHQLVCGWKTPEARVRDTLGAIAELSSARVLLDGELSHLSLGYLFWRIVEHHLQLRGLAPHPILPSSRVERADLAATIGFPDERSFEHALAAWATRIRGILERIYLAPGYVRLEEQERRLASLLSDRTPRGRVRAMLETFGLKDIDRAWQNLRLLARGGAGQALPPAERRAFLEFALPLLGVLRDSVDPDLALHRLESFATATGNRVSFLRTLASRRPHLVRLVNLLAVSNRCHQLLVRHPEYFDQLARGIHLHEGRTASEMKQELHSRLEEARGDGDPGLTLRRFRQREMVRIAYRDLAGLADELDISAELSALGEACVCAALRESGGNVDGKSEPIVVVAFGRFGGGRLHYASDLDLALVCDDPPVSQVEPSTDAHAALERRAEALLELLGGVTSEGIAYTVDLRLRPEGSSGLLVRSWEGYREYTERYMQPWERMALVRSRVVRGNPEQRMKWGALVAEAAYAFAWSPEAIGAVRHLKRRIENEKSRENRINLDFKYGSGGVADLEFLVQLLQVLRGGSSPGLRSTSTSEAISALGREGVLSGDESATLQSAHRFQRRVENRYQLLEEWGLREVSRESPLVARMAKSLGYSGIDSDARRKFLRDWQEHAAAVRQLVERHFYGTEA